MPTVLIVDDSPTQRAALRERLWRDLQAHVIEATDNAQAIGLFEASSRIDAIVTDQLHPGGPGSALGRTLRRVLGFRGPLVMMSACEFDAAKRRYLIEFLGFDAVIGGGEFDACMQLLSRLLEAAPAGTTSLENVENES